ncbi:MAG: DUF2322 family protein [Thiobacillus sp.]
MSFAETLKTLPEARGARLHLHNAAGAGVAAIDNAAGTAGSFRVYAYLAAKYGGISPAAAAEGLAIFAEHTDDARLNPGRHPNIDRLLAVQAAGDTLAVAIE